MDQKIKIPIRFPLKVVFSLGFLPPARALQTKISSAETSNSLVVANQINLNLEAFSGQIHPNRNNHCSVLIQIHQSTSPVYSLHKAQIQTLGTFFSRHHPPNHKSNNYFCQVTVLMCSFKSWWMRNRNLVWAPPTIVPSANRPSRGTITSWHI